MEQPIASSSTAPPLEVAASKNGRTIGKAHKSGKAPVRRSYISDAIKTPFAQRMEEEKKRQAVRALEKEMKEEKEAEKQMYVEPMSPTGVQLLISKGSGTS